MGLFAGIRKIRIEGHRETRKITCPYCDRTQRVSLVGHLKRSHPEQWEAWSTEFARLYNETNNPKRVMRHFRNSDGELILSWTAIETEIKRRAAVNGTPPSFLPKKHIPHWDPRPDEYKLFQTSVWDIPVRGAWGVHQSNYRGNWPPQVPRALLELYTKPGDLVLDPFVGGGTTLIEAWSLGRRAIGFDISEIAIAMTKARLDELANKAGRESLFGLPNVSVEVRKGDARKLPRIAKASVDFICTHPPYGDALQYTHDEPADLSRIANPSSFLAQLEIAGRRFYDVLKDSSYCAILIGDLRRNNTLNPLGFETIVRFRNIGFDLADIVIKTQNRDRSTEFYFSRDHNSRMRLRLAHEYLLVFVKSKTPVK